MKKSCCTVFKSSLILPALLLLLSSHAAWQVHPQAKIHQRPASKSRMLWNKDQKVADHAVSYFRYEFNVPEPVKNGIFRVYFDDAGEAFLNADLVYLRDEQRHLFCNDNSLIFG